jgi:hypothetical protein
MGLFGWLHTMFFARPWVQPDSSGRIVPTFVAAVAPRSASEGEFKCDLILHSSSAPTLPLTDVGLNVRLFRAPTQFLGISS